MIFARPKKSFAPRFARSFTVSDSVKFPHQGGLDGVSKMSLATWIYADPSAASFTPYFTQVDAAGQNGFELLKSNAAGQILFACRNASSSPNAALNVTFGAWQFWILVFDGTQATQSNRVRFYTNGGPNANIANPSVFPTTLGASTTQFVLGTFGSPGVVMRCAYLGLWVGVALTQADSAALYAGARIPPSGPPSLLWVPRADLTSKMDVDLIGGQAGRITGTTLMPFPLIGVGGARRRTLIPTPGNPSPVSVDIRGGMESIASSVRDELVPVETLATFIGDAVAPVGSGITVLRDAAVPAELVASVRSDPVAPAESIATFSRDGATPVESVSTKIADAKIPDEWAGFLVFTADASAPVEWLGSMAKDGVFLSEVAANLALTLRSGRVIGSGVRRRWSI